MRRSDDSGLTLVELLVAAAIGALITPVLTGALVLGWRTSTDTVDRLANTRNRQLVPSQFTRDMQSATAVDKTPTLSCKILTDTLLVQLTVVQPQSPASDVSQSIAWVLTPTMLVERRTCATGSTTVLSSVSAAHDVSAAAAYCRASYAAAQSATCSTASPIVDLVVTDITGSFTATGARRSS